MKIIGAGMAGLLAANMLRRFNPVILETQPSLPNNHAALLRFRTDAVSKATGIPFKKVTVHKAICCENIIHSSTNLKFNNMYSVKVTGRAEARSILSLSTVERYIAPSDFISQMAKSVTISYDHRWRLAETEAEPVISTIPMPMLMKALDWPTIPNFHSVPVTTIAGTLPGVDLYQTLYYPGEESWYRASITGDTITIEIAASEWKDDDSDSDREDVCKDVIDHVLYDFGLPETAVSNPRSTTQKYGKISPVGDDVRKQFILYATDTANIYSLGRFGVWRQLLLDDIVQDVHHIEMMISERTGYQRRMMCTK